MTQNQINYAKHREDVRHNQEMEAQGRSSISESARHNLAQEGISSQGVAAQMYAAGANYAHANAAYANVAELARHNAQQEQINWYTAENLAGLQAAQSSQALQTAELNKSKIGVDAMNARLTGLNYANQAVTRFVEAMETKRSNKAREAETQRHNAQTEQQGWANAISQGVRSIASIK